MNKIKRETNFTGVKRPSEDFLIVSLTKVTKVRWELGGSLMGKEGDQKGMSWNIYKITAEYNYDKIKLEELPSLTRI